MPALQKALVVVVGLGSTGLAHLATGLLAADSPPEVPGVTREEMEEELRRAEAEIAGAEASAQAGAQTGEPGEFRPSRPLPADLPIDLPSDF
jgi:hypothetical protein